MRDVSGYFSAGGEMDTCIVLRTAILKDGMIHVQAGAGIVHDSIPENEQQECINKGESRRPRRRRGRALCLKIRPWNDVWGSGGNGGMFG